MPVTAAATVTQPTFEVPKFDQANVMTWFSKNTKTGYKAASGGTAEVKSAVTFTGYIWDHSEAYVDWQLASPNTSTVPNDKVIGELTAYTDGYAMKIKGNLPGSYCVVGKACGFCLNAAENGSSCVLWTNPSGAGLNLASQANLWVPNSKWTATGAIFTTDDAATTLDTLYTDAIASAKTNVVPSDNVMGFNGNWYCPTPKGGSTGFDFECSRFLPKSTPTNAYSGDFRFAPKMEVGATNVSPPSYKIHLFTEAVPGKSNLSYF